MPSGRIAAVAGTVSVVLCCGCSGNKAASDASGDLAGDAPPHDVATADQRPADTGADTTSHSWDPGLPSTERLGTRRGLRVARGIIHCHSVNSHDACDGQPFVDGKPNEPCLADLRHAICATRLDFLMLAEHEDHYGEVPFVDTLLARGDDELIEKNGQPVATAIACDEAGASQPPLLLSGLELDETMPVGMERHVDVPADQLMAFYESGDPANDAQLREAGAVLLVAHTEQRPLDQLVAHDLDGIEVYNLHANLDPNIRKDIFGLDPFGYLLDAAPFGSSHPADPEPDLVFLAFFLESQPAIANWNGLLAKRHTSGVIGTDAHQNVLPVLWRDGERMDSYRRMFRWFSNHILVETVTFDAIKQAVARGRGYMVFEILGTPDHFDFHASAGAKTFEMGDDVALAAKPKLALALPGVLDLPQDGPQPTITARIIHIDANGKATTVAEGTDDLTLQADKSGAYRAEVHIVPEHLAPFLGTEPQLYIKKQIWIYSNPIYVN